MRRHVEGRVEKGRVGGAVAGSCLVPLVCLLAGLCLPARAQESATSPDTAFHSARGTHNSTLDTALVLLDAARVDAARRALQQARSWKRLLPSVSVHMSLSTRGRVFPALSAQGFDPAYAALQQWPGDTWGLSVSLRLDPFVDTRAREAAEAAYRMALRTRDVARARREADAQEAAHRRRATALRLAALAEEQRLAREEHAILADLLRLARLRFEAAEISYEALQGARLALLAKDGELARLEHEKTRLAHEVTRLDAARSVAPPPVALDD